MNMMTPINPSRSLTFTPSLFTNFTSQPSFGFFLFCLSPICLSINFIIHHSLWSYKESYRNWETQSNEFSFIWALNSPWSLFNLSISCICRMMMLEEEQIAFRSDSPTLDGIEDYSHQIAEMIELRNESSFIHIGVGGHLLFVRIYTSLMHV